MFSFIARSGVGRALRHRVFASYALAHAGSVVGLWIQRIAIQWLVWTLTGSYAWLGAIALAEAMAAMACSLAAGPFADRFDRIKLAYFTQGLLCCVAIALAVVTYLDLISIPVLALFVIVTGVLEGVWAPVRLALMPNLVPREDMPAAVALTSMMFTTAIFVGPALGGVIISWLGLQGAFIANAISYLGLLWVFGRMRGVIGQSQRMSNPTGYVSELGAGLAYVFNHAGVRSVVFLGVVFSLLIRPYRELFAGVADEIFLRGVEGLAALASAAGFGALVGAAAIAIYGSTRGLAKVLLTTGLTATVLLMVFSQSRHFGLSLVMVAGLSACVTIFSTGAQMLIQLSLDDAMRGRVMSIWQSQFRGLPAVGAWLVGLMVPLTGLSWVLFASAVLFALFVVYAVSWHSDLEALESVTD